MSIYVHRANEDGDMEVVEIHDSGDLDLEEGEDRYASGSSSSGKGRSSGLHRREEDGQIIDDESQRESRTKLIVNYLPQSLKDEELSAIFSRIGPVLSAKIIRDSISLYSYGYGFVEFANPEDAAEAVRQLKGYPIQNKRLGVSFARTHDRESLRNTNLYVANVPESHSNESSLRELFSPYGKIITLKLLRDERSGASRGTAFVRFDRKDEAENAIKNLNGLRLPDAFEGLVVRVSEEHGKQKAVYFSGWHPASNPASTMYHHHHHHRADPAAAYVAAGYAYARPRGPGAKSRGGGRVTGAGGPRFGRWNGGPTSRGNDRRPHRGGLGPAGYGSRWN